jgi:anti-anti-sigma factor
MGNAERMSHLRSERVREGVLSIEGEIDLSTADSLLDAVVAERGLGDLVLDCTDVTLIDSTGVQALLRARDALDGGTLVIRNPSRRVAAVFELVQADSWPRFEIEPTSSDGEGRTA